MSRADEIRIGIVGAGQVARARHLPNFQAIPGVRVVAVCNRHRDSSRRVAMEFGIPKVHGTWEDLIDDPDVDAVVIGTWPYLHCPITLAALDSGKHVLTQARMAMNTREAARMLEKAREHPGLTAMIVPSPLGLAGDATVRDWIAQGNLGNLREVFVQGLNTDLADPNTPLHWRQITRYSGFNMLNLGILHETLSRWIPQPRKVIALGSTLIPTRHDESTGEPVRAGTPDSVQVITVLPENARGLYRLSGVLWHDAGSRIALYGDEGSLVYDLSGERIRAARRGEAMQLLPIPDHLRGEWEVEAEFVGAIRGERPVRRTTFEAGLQYMQFTEAVARSSRHLTPIDLPLKEFSNPSLVV